MKIVGDGSPQGKTAFWTKPLLTPGPSGEKEWCGEPNVSLEETKNVVQLAYDNGIQVLMHCNGDATVDMLLDAHEAAVNIDGELIASAGTHAIQLINGCICCTIGGDLILALQELLTRDAVPERIVIEASGVSDPRAVARIAACHPALHVQGTIVIADAETIVERANDKYVGGLVRRQLGAGDAVILNKVDLIDEDRLTAVRQWVSATNPGVPVFESSIEAGFPIEIVFDSDLAGLREELAEPNGDDEATFTSVTYQSARPFDRARFLDAARGMIPAIARAKGTLYFADEPETRYLFQLSGERCSVEPFAPGEPQRQSKIVAIAVTERTSQLEDTLQALHRAQHL